MQCCGNCHYYITEGSLCICQNTDTYHTAPNDFCNYWKEKGETEAEKLVAVFERLEAIGAIKIRRKAEVAELLAQNCVAVLPAPVGAPIWVVHHSYVSYPAENRLRFECVPYDPAVHPATAKGFRLSYHNPYYFLTLEDAKKAFDSEPWKYPTVIYAEPKYHDEFTKAGLKAKW